MTTPIDLRLGNWLDVLADVVEVDALITDPPYSDRTHEGHDAGGKDGADRRDLSYTAWSSKEIGHFLARWGPATAGWFVCLSDSVLTEPWRAGFEGVGLTGFHPLPCVIPGMTVRMAGDGPSSWAIYANVARPKALHKWGTLRGAYEATQDRDQHIGGKPLALMRAIIRDYTKPGDLVCDPCAGNATTLIAAAMEGRRAIGAEVDPDTFAKAQARIAKGVTQDLFSRPAPEPPKPKPKQAAIFCPKCLGSGEVRRNKKDGFKTCPACGGAGI